MNLRLGIDTGGTYTDAVLFEEAEGVRGRVVAKAKCLTSKHDLMIGVRGALEAVLADLPAPKQPEAQPAQREAARIALVSLSTTLATNAIVEGHGANSALVLIGLDEKALDRAGLRAALKGDPVIFVDGGHKASGEELRPLDLTALERQVAAVAPRVSAFAVVGIFGVRNPAHENAARVLIRELTGLPVTCAHELSSHLDAPRRALTTLLNARLIPQLQQLILALRTILEEKAIAAPLMVVKGDGSLVSDSFALASPVETILSGPAASVVGACYLSDQKDLVVSDIGGTTTDIAFLEAGRPALDGEGARVAGWRTMVEAVRVHTYGLGGDSEISLQEARPGHGMRPGKETSLGTLPGFALRVGPRRIVPLAILARDHAGVLESLRRQAADGDLLDGHGRFALRLRPRDTANLAPMEEKLWDALGTGPQPLGNLARQPSQQRPLQRLVDRGLAIFAGFTPTDACHLLGLQQEGLREAALLGAQILARQARQRYGAGLLAPEDLARTCLEALYQRSGEVLVESALAESGALPLEPRDGPARQLVALGLAREKQGLLRLDFSLDRPLVAIGASAATYYPEIAKRLGAQLLVPEHAEVCNALGAVVGGVFQQVRILVTKPGEGTYRAHLGDGPKDFPDLASAREVAEKEARRRAWHQAEAAGARDIRVNLTVELKKADLAGGQEMFFELAILAQALGRPRQTAALPGR